MAIREYSPNVREPLIAFVGGMPQAEDLSLFQAHQFLCELYKADDLCQSEKVTKLHAVIWTQDPNSKSKTLLEEFRAIIPNLLDRGVEVYIRLVKEKNSTDVPRKLVINALLTNKIPIANLREDERLTTENPLERQNSFLSPYVFIFESTLSWASIAAEVCARPVGPSSKLMNVDEEFLYKRFVSDGHTERVMLLKRAFWNCTELQLESLLGGISGASVFKAYASTDTGLRQPGQRVAYPHLYFVKIGPRKKIADEYDRYYGPNGYIFEYVPFHLGPRLRRDRCNLGSTQGILVSDYVEGAESLITCARGARSGHAISNLFDKTLGAWRKQKHLDTTRTLSSYLKGKWDNEDSDTLITLPPARAEIVRQLGGDPDILSLKKIFENHANTSVLIAPAHGDMHANNVLVRHGDAILIDLEKLEEHYPLTYDPASLEGGFLVEGFVKDLKKKKFELNEFIKLLEPLYKQSAFKSGGITPCWPGNPVEWYYNVINQIRTLSWSAEHESGQYALTLAFCLIRKGCNKHKDLLAEPHNTLRAIAFFFGQKILHEIN